MSLYCKELGLPPEERLRFGAVRLIYSKHAWFAAQTDRFGLIKLPFELDTDTAEIVEAEVDDATGEVIKVVYLVPYSDRYNLLLVVGTSQARFGTVKTVWLNHVDDNHPGLRLERYQPYLMQEAI